MELSPRNQNPRHTLDIFEDDEQQDAEAPPAEEEQEIPLTPMQKARATVEVVAEGLPVTIVMSLFTLWALFSDDIRTSATDSTADEAFMIIISIAFFLFFFEICAQSFYKEGYLHLPSFASVPGETKWGIAKRLLNFGSFYFWLDWIATLSLIFEMTWIIGDAVDVKNQASLKSARAGRASRAGARAGRIVRLVRMVKLYKYMSREQEKLDSSVSGSRSGLPRSGSGTIQEKIRDTAARHRSKSRSKSKSKDASSGIMDMQPESRVGAAMSDLTTRRVIVLVLVLLVVIPLLTYTASDVSTTFGAAMTHHMAKSNPNVTLQDNAGFVLAVENMQDYHKILQVKVNDEYYINKRDQIDLLRDSEKLVIREVTRDLPGFDGNFVTVVIFDVSTASRVTGEHGIYMTLFILVLLVMGTYYFSSDVNRLVILPIEKMVALVGEISKNPLGVDYKMLGEEDGFLEGMETTLLLQTINKIGGLMRVGFGEAGASVIAKNLNESEGHVLNLMGSGTLIHSIFGFCDVRNFTDTTECLQEEVMLFVNRIAHILHSIVVQCSGAANKNIGDAFLLTWKINDTFSPTDISRLADQALLAFCKGLVELCRYQDFICNFSIPATNRLYKRFPGYKVRIGCGLHVGWAIEGAIGSHRKIDASYLSPHVNMSEFLESSTKTYGVSLLMSEAFFRFLSPQVSRYCRQVDRIKRSDAEEPFGLFTYDADLTYDFGDVEGFTKMMPPPAATTRRQSVVAGLIQPPSASLAPQTAAKKKQSVAVAAMPQGSKQHDIEAGGSGLSRERADKEKSPTIVVAKYSVDVWDTDLDLVHLRNQVNDQFRSLWKEGFAAFIKGDWAKARDIFHVTLSLPAMSDGPSKFLIKVIDEHGGTVPHNWNGYRQE